MQPLGREAVFLLKKKLSAIAKNLFFVEVIDGRGNCGQSLSHLLNIIIVKVYVELKTSSTSGTESGKAGEVSYGWAVYPASQVLVYASVSGTISDLICLYYNILSSFTLYYDNHSLQSISTHIILLQQITYKQEVTNKVIEERRELMPWDLMDVDRKEAPKK